MENFNFTKAGLKIIVIVTVLLAIQSHNSVAQEFCIGSSADQITGTQGGYRHELWNQNSQGTACMTLGQGGAFSGRWSGIQNYLGRRGLGYDQTRTPDSYGTFYGNFDCTYNPASGSAGNSYLAVYGWMWNPSTQYLVEYYIVEDWRNWNPSMASGAVIKGTLYCDGSEYDILQRTHNGPSIKSGVTTFQQYFSIRKTPRNFGPLSISNHFRRWAQLQMPLANLHEVSMLVEGYQNSGSFNFNSMYIAADPGPQAQSVNIIESAYNLSVGDVTSRIEFSYAPAGSSLVHYNFRSSNPNVASVEVYKGNFYLKANGVGTATLTLSHGGGLSTDMATINVSAAGATSRNVSFRAMGTQGTEQVALLINGQAIKTYTLTKSFQNYTEVVNGSGDVTVEFLNDDNITNGRDARLDYISIDGVKRETEAMAVNTAVYKNGVCGGGYSEWLNCNGAVNYGALPPPQNHTIRIRARGNAGGEHIDLLINGLPVTSGWTLGTAFKEYTVTVPGDGDIRVEYDNDGGSRDVIVDWLKVDNQNPRQAENMQYNTGFFANGRCGGGSYSEWMQCNGVIGFGKISDNFGEGARVSLDVAALSSETENKNSDFSLSPNPSAGNVFIKFDNGTQNTSIKIYDAGGRGIVFSRENIHENEIWITDLASGFYIVNVKRGEFMHRKKLVVIKE